MHQRQVLGHPPQLLDSAVVAFSAARPVRLLVRLFTPNGPASLPACHSNNGTPRANDMILNSLLAYREPIRSGVL